MLIHVLSLVEDIEVLSTHPTNTNKIKFDKKFKKYLDSYNKYMITHKPNKTVELALKSIKEIRESIN